MIMMLMLAERTFIPIIHRNTLKYFVFVYKFAILAEKIGLSL
ncbi:hypothetical protein KP77_33650 [Jeotgalibacillus alimentarius]|uniref:Uncharacterized protein n=1 Tax=Jeotgalibacillus alimentarius TaxID=135826 RepID=A0A0C2QXC1_9BACL|nr:hypothetical protein KP77_33650 [Jeotgalibacillus alimentarius]